MTRWRKPYKSHLIFDELNEARVVRQEPERAAFSGGALGHALPLLAAALRLHREICPEDKLGVIRSAVFDVANQGPLNDEAFTAQLLRREAEYLARPLKTHVLLTHLHGPRGISESPSLRSRGFRLDFPPRSFIDERARLIERFPRLASVNQDSRLDQAWLRIITKARSAYDAIYRGTYSFDLLRAVWNFCMNHGSGTRMTFGNFYPVNPILRGPILTVHTSKGKLLSELVWYDGDTDYGRIWPARFSTDQEQLLRDNSAWWRKRLSGHPYRRDIQKWLIGYCRALDEPRQRNAFLTLWQAFEGVSGADSSGNTDRSILRTSFLYQDSERQRQELHYLRERRNDVVHTLPVGDTHSDMEEAIYQLKTYVERLLLMHAFHGRRFGSPAGLFELWDQPPDLRTLRERSRLLRRAMRWRAPRET
ncbi:MAG: hypothetical protein H6716_26710 [Polyangiaceae bacterium]|nr:hypothetical protein [Polyangiaceae bacterium]